MGSHVIYTLTCNPAIDRSILVDSINKVDVTRVKKTIRDAAGKGINTSKVLKKLGVNSLNLGFIAGSNGVFIEETLDQLHIKHAFIKCIGETRENIKVISKSDNTLEFNESGPTVSDKQLDDLYKYIKSLQKSDVLIMGGSVPNGVPKNIYMEIMNQLNTKGVTTICDTSGDLFKESIKGKPSIIKPNVFELEQYFNKKYSTEQDIINDCRLLNKEGISLIFVSMGEDGALLITKDEVFKAHIPVVDVKSTVGAGDSFVAGIAYGLCNNQKHEELLLTACSVGTASVLTESTAEVNIEDVKEIMKQIKIEKLEV